MNRNVIQVCLLLLCTIFNIPHSYGLLVRATVYAKKIAAHAKESVQLVVLCGDNHAAGSPETNLKQFYECLNQAKNIAQPFHILVENQRAHSEWFNDTVDEKLFDLLQEDAWHCVRRNEPGPFTTIFLFGAPKKFFPAHYHPALEKLSVTNVECRQFLYYTALFNNELLKVNFANPYLIRQFKQLQKQKCLRYSLEDVFKIPYAIAHYHNNIHDVHAKKIFKEIKNKIEIDIKNIQQYWAHLHLRNRSIVHRPIWSVHLENQQEKTYLYKSSTKTSAAHYLNNPFDDEVCFSILEKQLLDEMIEANTLWHIIRQDAPRRLFVAIGSLHSGQLFQFSDHKHGLGKYLKELGYQELASGGIKDISQIDERFSILLSSSLPKWTFEWLAKNEADLLKDLTISTTTPQSMPMAKA